MPSCHFSVRYPNLSLEPTTAAAAISATGVILRWMFEQYAREGPLAASGWVAERGTAWASVCARYDTGRSIPARQLALSTCAVKRRRFPVGASPTRQPLQPEATGAVMEVTKWLKPSGKRATNWWQRECAGRNASER